MQDEHLVRLPDGRVRIDVRFLVPGTVLAWPTFNDANEMVHLAYRPFTADEVEDLIREGVEYLYYTGQTDVGRQYVKDLKGYLDQEIYQGPRTITVETQKKAVSAMMEIVQFIKSGQVTDFSDAKNIVEYVLNDIHTSKDDFINLLDIQEYDDYTYTHSLNVGVIAMVLGKRMNLSDAVLFNVGMAGFLHDIGKLRIPNEIINKPGKLTDEEYRTIKNHPRFGYEMVKGSPHVNEVVQRLILFHHERADGSGYPLGLTQEKLGNLTFIIAIADFYDAMTSARSYKRALTPKEAMQVIMKQAVTHFPDKVVQQFMADMKDILREGSFYELGMIVLLNTREVGRVVDKDFTATTRPVLEILRNSRGEVLKKPIRVDMNYDGSRYISKILSNDDSAIVDEYFG
ncbi:MAG TPA: HD-GYP domain-containing protein [Spirochaetota bacterium]|mgnify:FL=1|nr:HD-GYP domain-containing protein [Spirochaetota bacterium]